MAHYSKPELSILGDAASVIRGDKHVFLEIDPTKLQTPDCEFDD